MADFKVLFDDGKNTFNIGLEDCRSFCVNMGETQPVHIGAPEPYEGAYETIPTVDGSTLSTAEKYLIKDITVAPIPYSEVSNVANGKTVTIG